MQILKAKILVSSFYPWYMDHTAKSYENFGALAGLYIGNKNIRGVSMYKRAWIYHICMKPFYHLIPSFEHQRIGYLYFSKLFDLWLKAQSFPAFNAVQAVSWGAKAPFDIAERHGALKILDALNSYPTVYDGCERRESALWARSFRPAVPSQTIFQAVRDIERSDIILCPSLWVRDSMLANGIPESKCFLNPFGVDTSMFKERTILPRHPVFVTTGSICLRKGHQYLFQAFKLLKEKYPDAELICFGRVATDFKPIWPRWKHLVTHHGFVPHSHLSACYQNSTAFVLPSTEEGFARAIIEAMASGLPILATHESGASTLVEHRKEGFIFPSRRVDVIYKAMLETVDNPVLCEYMGRNAARKGRHANTWNDYAERNLAVINNALQSKSRDFR